MRFFASVNQFMPELLARQHRAPVRANNVAPAQPDCPVKQGDPSQPSHAI
jgi:hypothetical protein